MEESCKPTVFCATYKTLSIWMAFCGLKLHGLLNNLPKSYSSIINFFMVSINIVLWTVVGYWSVGTTYLVLENVSYKRFSEAGVRLVHIFLYWSTLHRLYIIKFRNLQINTIVDHLNGFLSQGMNQYGKKEMVQHIRDQVTVFAVYIWFAVTAQSAYFVNSTTYKLGWFPVKILVERFFPNLNYIVLSLLFQLISYSHLFVNAGFSFLVGSFLGTIRVELKALRAELTEIFDTQQIDRTGNIYFSENMKIQKLNHDSGEWISNSRNPVDIGRVLKAQNIRECSDRLAVWIKKHQNVIECQQNVKNYLHLAVAFTYTSNVVATASLIVAQNTNTPHSLVGYSIIILLNLLGLCVFGQQVIDESSNIAFDALGKSYHLYPVHMQKALMMIVQRSQRPLQIDNYGLFPLSLVTFWKIMQLCYTLVSFLGGFNE